MPSELKALITRLRHREHARKHAREKYREKAAAGFKQKQSATTSEQRQTYNRNRREKAARTRQREKEAQDGTVHMLRGLSIVSAISIRLDRTWWIGPGKETETRLEKIADEILRKAGRKT